MFIGTTESLDANETYTSESRLVDRADRIAGLVFADQAGTLYVEQSADGTNWDLSTSVNITANTGTKFSEELIAPYVRVRYTNGASGQGAFRLSAKTTSAGDS